jgi:RES domain
LTTWTQRALASEARPYARELWRVVEAQHTASTMRLTDSLEEQARLEALLEDSKPPLPAGMQALHYLLATPFRYRPPNGSRFRAAYEPGVWYGAEALRTALAEKSYWRLRFLLDSPGTPDLKPVPHSAFQARARSQRTLDLTVAPLAHERAGWIDPGSYVATQELATTARSAQIEMIRYESVRDPAHAACVVALTPAVFGRAQPHALESWFIAASREAVRCVAVGAGGGRFDFAAAQLLGAP